MFAPITQVNLVFRPAVTVFDLSILQRCSPVACFVPMSGSPDAAIVYHPSSENYWEAFAHEIGHAAGFFSEATGGDPFCGGPDKGVPSDSPSLICIKRWDDQVQSDKRRFDRRQARQAEEEKAKEKPI